MIEISSRRIEAFQSNLRIPKLNIEQGSFNLVLGHNSSGKTLFLNSLSGIVDGKSEPLIKDKSIGFVSSQFPFQKDYRIKYIADLLRRLDNGFEMNVFKFYFKEYFDLSDLSLVGELSLGQKRILHLCLVIARKPEVLLLDDITNGLDQKHKKMVLEICQDLTYTHGITIIAATNLIEDFASVSDHFYLIKNKSLKYLGDAVSITQNYNPWSGSKEAFEEIPKDHVLASRNDARGVLALLDTEIYGTIDITITKLILLIEGMC